MKRIICFLLCLMMICSFCACGENNEPGNIGETAQETPDTTSSTSTANHIGTRSNPYSFTDEILITTKDRHNDYIVEYTISLNELWGGSKVSAEFPDYIIDDLILVRGQITVNCDSTDDEIDFDLDATYLTSSLNEEPATIETYKKGELNNILRTVYSGGSYDIIILGANDGMGSLGIGLLKIGYTDIEGNYANIWIQLPEISDAPEETSTNTGVQSSDNDSISDAPSESQNELTSEEKDVENDKEDSEKEEKYQLAVEYENALCYTYAKILFEEILDYRDAKEHYDKMIEILSPYDGTYSIDFFGGGRYQMKIKDGEGTIKVDGSPEKIFYIDLMGYDFNGTSDDISMVFVQTGYTDDNSMPVRYRVYDNVDTYIIHLYEGNEVMVMACEGNKFTSYNGYGTKK